MLTREGFTAAIAARFRDKYGVPDEDAAGYAEQVLDGFLSSEKDGIEYGDPKYGWTEADAHGIADEDVSYWE